MPEPISSENEPRAEASKKPKIERRGDVGLCPVCGSEINPQAYHCAVCSNSFCYQCRARLLPSDKQLECVNQDCEYYGKLVCSLCDTPEELSHVAVYIEPEDGYWPVLLVLVLVLSAFVWAWSSLGWATLFAIVFYVVVGLLLHRLGVNIFGRERRVEHQRKSLEYHCLCCRQPVKELPLDDGKL